MPNRDDSSGQMRRRRCDGAFKLSLLYNISGSGMSSPDVRVIRRLVLRYRDKH